MTLVTWSMSATTPHVACCLCSRLIIRRGIASRRGLDVNADETNGQQQQSNSASDDPQGYDTDGHSAASFLLRQAELEAADEQAAIEAQRASQERILQRARASGQTQGQGKNMEPAWDGEETQERMIRRILEDQYKPLRIKVTASAL